MLRSISRFAVLALVSGTVLAAAAAHAESYPRVVGTGENASVEYGPGPAANIVGGGRVETTGSGEFFQIHHLDSRFAQMPRPGLAPQVVGQGENRSVVWTARGRVTS